MATPSLSLDALRALDAIARKGSFAAAAESLFKVPSALTYTIAKLEQDLGVQLFDRSKQRARLTKTGALLLEHGRELLQASQRLEELIRQQDSGWEPRLRLLVDTIVDIDWLWPLVDSFHQQQQFSQLQLVEEVMAGSWEALLRDRCDVAIGLAGEGVPAQIELHPMARVEFVFAVAPSHPLAQLKRPVHTEDLLAHTTVLVRDSAHELPNRDSGVFASGRQLFVPTMAAKIAAQAAGIGVGFVPRFRLQPYLASGQLCLLETDIQREPVSLYLGWRKDRAPGHANTWWREQLLQLPWAELMMVKGAAHDNAPV